MKRPSALAFVAFVAFSTLGQEAGRTPPNRQMLLEQKHFMESLASVYDPSFWISYHGELFFMPKTEAQEKQIEALRNARSHYVALTNRLVRYEAVAKTLATSGLSTNSQRQRLLPYSETNENLSPTIDKAL